MKNGKNREDFFYWDDALNVSHLGQPGLTAMDNDQMYDIELLRPTFVEREQKYDEDLLLQLEEEKNKNDKLMQFLEEKTINLKKTNDELQKVNKLNHKLQQDLEMQVIYSKNLKSINAKFVRTINNLQSYREYVTHLLKKRNRTNDRIFRLIKTIKHLQNIIKSKNEILTKFGHNYHLIVKKASHIIRARIQEGNDI